MGGGTNSQGVSSQHRSCSLAIAHVWKRQPRCVWHGMGWGDDTIPTARPFTMDVSSVRVDGGAEPIRSDSKAAAAARRCVETGI
eukprot:6183950-Pleurochrysis_carterae.AAC.1